MENKNTYLKTKAKSLDEIGTILGHHKIPHKIMNNVSNYLKEGIEKQDEDLKKAFIRDELPSDTKFGDWDIELRNGYYHVSTEFLADDFESDDFESDDFESDENLELPSSRNREELLFYSKELTFLNKIFYEDYNIKELSEIIAYKSFQLEDLKKQFQKRMTNENKNNN